MKPDLHQLAHDYTCEAFGAMPPLCPRTPGYIDEGAAAKWLRREAAVLHLLEWLERKGLVRP